MGVISRTMQIFQKSERESSSLDSEMIYRFINESQVASDQLLSAVDEVHSAMDRLNRIADKSVSGGEGLKESSDKAMEQIQEAFAALQQVSAAAEQIKEISSQLRSESSDSLETVSDVMKSLVNTKQMAAELKEYNQSVGKKIAELANLATTIEEMNSVIKDIVKKTTMLSLNASIEATRAGEFGKGFSVVAQEIKSLSDQSRDAVDQSSELLSAVEASLNDVVGSVENEKKAVEKGIGEIEKMSDQMEGIYQKIRSVHQQIEQTEHASYNQSTMTSNAVAKLEMVVDTVDLTLDFVNQTVEEMNLQHKEAGYLHFIGKGLHETSSSLAAAIQGINVENRGFTQDIQYVAEMEKLLVEISSCQELKTLDSKLHKEILSAYFDKTEQIEAIWSNKADGTFIFSMPEAGLFNAKHREWWKQAMDGAVYVSDPYISAITKTSCITLSQAIKNSDGETIGVIGMDLHIKIEQQ